MYNRNKTHILPEVVGFQVKRLLFSQAQQDTDACFLLPPKNGCIGTAKGLNRGNQYRSRVQSGFKKYRLEFVIYASRNRIDGIGKPLYLTPGWFPSHI
jgi:hypothetical protein